MPMIDTADGPIHYQQIDLLPPWQADRPAILFHHGLGATSDIWAEWLPALCSRFRLVRFDCRGLGRSSVPARGFSWSLDQLAGDTLAVAQAAGADRFHFVGESLGGIVGYHLAVHRPDVLLTMTSCNASHRGSRIEGGIDRWARLVEAEGMAGWSRMMMEARFAPGSLPADAWAWFEKVQSATPGEVNLEVSGMLRRMDIAAQLPTIRVPTLLLAGEASPFVPLDMQREIAGLIPGSELQVIAGARHGVVFSHARECARMLEAFIDRH